MPRPTSGASRHERVSVSRVLTGVAAGLALIGWLSPAPLSEWYLDRLGLAQPAAVGASTSQAAATPAEPAAERPALRLDLPPDANLPLRLSVSASALGNPCAAGAPVNPSRAPRREVYRWTDVDGRVHFADRAPAGVEVETVGDTLSPGVGGFSLDYRYLGGEPPADLGLALGANIDGVLRIVARELGLANARPVHVKLRIIEGDGEFAAYSERFAKGLVTMGGFYSFNGNEAVVRWTEVDQTLAAARHEIAHLALGNWVGLTPLWLNEGLAQVVERLEFRHSFARAESPGAEVLYLRRLHAEGRLPGLDWLLTSEQEDWRRTGFEITYPYAWSLVHFLIQDSEGSRILRAYLSTLAARRCQAVDHLALLADLYPGGLPGLGADWRRWLLEGRPAALQL
ncbi:MAG: DUF4124 domain-containing protein [Chromatiaceae bacterium]|nr:DUF4124 domain-containing protein [Chromatiaceae bacterium]